MIFNQCWLINIWCGNLGGGGGGGGDGPLSPLVPLPMPVSIMCPDLRVSTLKRYLHSVPQSGPIPYQRTPLLWEQKKGDLFEVHCLRLQLHFQ